MIYKIRFGIPEVQDYWNDLSKKFGKGSLKGNERKSLKKFGKALKILSQNPRHNSLESHEIKPLSIKYGMKVWQSYLESRTPAAGRIFWVYGPGKGEITIVGIEPHPEDKKQSGYKKVNLSKLL